MCDKKKKRLRERSEQRGSEKERNYIDTWKLDAEISKHNEKKYKRKQQQQQQTQQR